MLFHQQWLYNTEPANGTYHTTFFYWLKWRRGTEWWVPQVVIEWETESGPRKTCALLTSMKLVFDVILAMTGSHENACDAYTGVFCYLNSFLVQDCMWCVWYMFQTQQLFTFHWPPSFLYSIVSVEKNNFSAAQRFGSHRRWKPMDCRQLKYPCRQSLKMSPALENIKYEQPESYIKKEWENI